MNGCLEKSLTWHVWIVCGAYATAGILWILVSDQLLPLLASPNQMMQLQSWKGIFFVITTTLLLAIIIRIKDNYIIELFDRMRGQMQHFQAAFKQVEQKLGDSLREKDHLLIELHHRVKNNLAVISGLIELQIDSTNDPQVRQVLKDSMMRVKSMALIHESYYESIQLTHVSLDSYLQDFIRYVHRVYEAAGEYARIELDAQPLMLNINQAMPCGLLLTELLLNYYKSKNPGGKISPIFVTLQQSTDGIVSLRIVGGSMRLTSSSEALTLSRSIIEALSSQLEATVDINHKADGTEVTISFTRQDDKRGSSDALS